jgi:hypothetical protein
LVRFTGLNGRPSCIKEDDQQFFFPPVQVS